MDTPYESVSCSAVFSGLPSIAVLHQLFRPSSTNRILKTLGGHTSVKTEDYNRPTVL